MSEIFLPVAEIRRDLHPKRLIPALSAGLVTGILATIMSVSMAALIFSGPLRST